MPLSSTGRIADALVLTFTSGVSLESWRSGGGLDREWALYEALAPRYGRIVVVTYGGGVDEAIARSLPGDPVVVANTTEASEADYVASIPARVREVVSGAATVVVKTNQMAGGHVAVAVTEALRTSGIRVGLIARGGFLWSRFVALEMGSAGHIAAVNAREEERSLCQAADLVVGTSPAMVGDLEWLVGLDPRRTRLIPNYVLADLPVRMPDERDPAMVLYAGQLVTRKRVQILIEAVATVQRGGLREAVLHVIGDGPEEGRLRELAKRMGIQAVFESRVPHEALLDRMSRCAVYAQASAYEGHPKTVIEAMATGAAVVVADSPGQGRVVQHGVTGLAMPPEPDAFARAIEGLLDDSAWREALGMAASTHVLMSYGLPTIVQREIEAHQTALVRAGEDIASPDREVRWSRALLRAGPDEAATRWRRSIEAFARRLPAEARGEFTEAMAAAALGATPPRIDPHQGIEAPGRARRGGS